MDQTVNKRILVVGGDTHFSYLMQRYVKTSAYQIITANLGDDVLALAKCEKPAAIVLEVNLPDTIGWLILQALKSDPEATSIPVIVCSWLDEEIRSREQGADCYLHMPILYADFDAALTTIMKNQNEKSY